MTKRLAIIGSGPAGLSAAINAASEGIEVTVYDRASELGGQFKESNSIQNYPGFRDVAGEELSRTFLEQAMSFGVKFCAPFNVAGIEPSSEGIAVVGDDWRKDTFDAVVLALGVQWKQLEAPGLAELTGRGVFYGAPPAIPQGKRVAIVGAGNSAGQEAVKLAKLGNTVTMLVRKTLDSQMSQYLIDQIDGVTGITVVEGIEIEAAGKNDEGIRLALTGGKYMSVDLVLIYIGGTPHTYWLKDTIDLGPQGYITTKVDEWADPFQTSVQGVFAIGDARYGSCKRIAAAIGEGGSVVPYIHRYLATKETK